jgi:hypothetical integral membrane protein (TIGR02206 family)
VSKVLYSVAAWLPPASTMHENLFTPYYEGPPFEFFAGPHVAALAVIAAGCLLLAGLFHNWRNSALRPWLRWGLFAFAVLNIIAWDGWQLHYDLWNPTYSLPLHICTLSVWLSAALLLTRNYRLYELLYFWGLAGATQALLTPELGIYGYPHFRYWIFFTSHGAILLTVFYMTFAEQMRPTWSSIPRVAWQTLLLMLIVGGVNWLTGGNYMYIARPPATASLIDVLGPWPWYIGPLILIGLLSFLICYLPFAINDRLRRA